jgi:3-isopropylmalate/(R)-2-methylmalate dehydratase large subunit
MEHLKPDGRILFLCSDPDLIERQLAGEDLPLTDVGALRNEVSTDEITPVPKMTFFDQRLGAFCYIGFKAGERFPIGREAARSGGFAVTVAGERYGKGSSREHSPFAERLAGIRLVIAHSFERIYRQNADNIGLFTSTDFGLIERLRRGEPIPIDELLASRDALTASILRAGGLLRYGQRALSATALTADVPSADHPLTYAAKIIARHRLITAETAGALEPGRGIFVATDWRYIHEMYTGMATHMLDELYGKPFPMTAPERVLAFEDHLSYAHCSAAVETGVMTDFGGLSSAHRRFAADYGVKNHGFLATEGSEGICHPMVTERYALPGQLIAATDSHTPHSGSIGSVAFGVGTTDMANAFVTGVVRITMPQSLLCRIDGRLRPGVTAKDVVLHLLARPDVRAGLCVGKLVEFTGTVVDALATDERATLTNMTAELGGFTGIVAPDDETVRFLREQRGLEFTIEPWMRTDPGAVFDSVIAVDCSDLEPMVAAPGDPGNGVPLSAVAERPAIDIAYGGSCTGGKRIDFDQYHEVLAWAAARNLKVPARTRLYLQFGTVGVRDYCAERGYLEAFALVGAQILMPSCGACANLGPGGSTRPDEVTVSAQNRNFPGRSGPGKLWVASPATVAASAIAGRLLSFAELQQAVG